MESKPKEAFEFSGYWYSIASLPQHTTYSSCPERTPSVAYLTASSPKTSKSLWTHNTLPKPHPRWLLTRSSGNAGRERLARAKQGEQTHDEHVDELTVIIIELVFL